MEKKKSELVKVIAGYIMALIILLFIDRQRSLLLNKSPFLAERDHTLVKI